MSDRHVHWSECCASVCCDDRAHDLTKEDDRSTSRERRRSKDHSPVDTARQRGRDCFETSQRRSKDRSMSQNREVRYDRCTSYTGREIHGERQIDTDRERDYHNRDAQSSPRSSKPDRHRSSILPCIKRSRSASESTKAPPTTGDPISTARKPSLEDAHTENARYRTNALLFTCLHIFACQIEVQCMQADEANSIC
jgi:hypothetical protein